MLLSIAALTRMWTSLLSAFIEHQLCCQQRSSCTAFLGSVLHKYFAPTTDFIFICLIEKQQPPKQGNGTARKDARDCCTLPLKDSLCTPGSSLGISSAFAIQLVAARHYQFTTFIFIVQSTEAEWLERESLGGHTAVPWQSGQVPAETGLRNAT